MATLLNKRVTRQTHAIAERGRPLIVILEPGDLIAFRVKGDHKTYRLPLMACFWTAVKASVEETKQEKIRARKERQRERDARRCAAGR